MKRWARGMSWILCAPCCAGAAQRRRGNRRWTCRTKGAAGDGYSPHRRRQAPQSALATPTPTAAPQSATPRPTATPKATAKSQRRPRRLRRRRPPPHAKADGHPSRKERALWRSSTWRKRPINWSSCWPAAARPPCRSTKTGRPVAAGVQRQRAHRQKRFGQDQRGRRQDAERRIQLYQAFGVAGNPGTRFAYTKVDQSHYWVDDSDSAYYNRLVSTDEVQKDWDSAEHLIEMRTAYAYALALNYNSACTPGQGGAIFCTPIPAGRRLAASPFHKRRCGSYSDAFALRPHPRHHTKKGCHP